jgi:hypothetical protein
LITINIEDFLKDNNQHPEPSPASGAGVILLLDGSTGLSLDFYSRQGYIIRHSGFV